MTANSLREHAMKRYDIIFKWFTVEKLPGPPFSGMY